MTKDPIQSVNLGSRRIAKLRMADFPNADAIVREGLLTAPRSGHNVCIRTISHATAVVPDRRTSCG